jgi:hypothetical protein
MLKFAAIAIMVIALAGFIVMRLWNWLTPALFGWHVITFWQALGILILSKILFGGFRGRSGPPGFLRSRMMERWAGMSPEERDKWRQSMRGCGPFRAPSTENKG